MHLRATPGVWGHYATAQPAIADGFLTGNRAQRAMRLRTTSISENFSATPLFPTEVFSFFRICVSKKGYPRPPPVLVLNLILQVYFPLVANSDSGGGSEHIIHQYPTYRGCRRGRAALPRVDKGSISPQSSFP